MSATKKLLEGKSSAPLAALRGVTGFLDQMMKEFKKLDANEWEVTNNARRIETALVDAYRRMPDP